MALFVVLALVWIGVANAQGNGSEYIPPNEPENIEAISDVFYALMQGQADQGVTWLRQAHAKQHGCVIAYFTVSSTIDPDYANGIFANQTTYPAFIRFSNGLGRGFSTASNNDASDHSLDTRGMAIKLFQVPGPKLLIPTAETQDFLFTTSEVGFLGDEDTAVKFFQAVQKGTLSFTAFLALHPSLALLYADFGINGAINDLLTADWFSQVPSRLGAKAAKFMLTPVDCSSKKRKENVERQDPNYLRTQLQQDLSQGSACFNFSAQYYTDDEDTPIEDPTVQWNSPWVTIAEVKIPPQYVWSDGQDAFCRHTAFNPWHSIAAHRPLGFAQRIRKAVYSQDATERHDILGQPDAEATYSDWVNYPNM